MHCVLSTDLTFDLRPYDTILSCSARAPVHTTPITDTSRYCQYNASIRPTCSLLHTHRNTSFIFLPPGRNSDICPLQFRLRLIYTYFFTHVRLDCRSMV